MKKRTSFKRFNALLTTFVFLSLTFLQPLAAVAEQPVSVEQAVVSETAVPGATVEDEPAQISETENAPKAEGEKPIVEEEPEEEPEEEEIPWSEPEPEVEEEPEPIVEEAAPKKPAKTAFDIMMEKESEKLDEGLAEAERLQREAEALLASLGIKL